MNIQFINRNIKAGFSFAKVFNPIMEYLARDNEVTSIEVPEYRGLPWHSLRNICFVRKRTKQKNVIHHVTGLPELAIGVCRRNLVLTFHDINFMTNTKNPMARYYKYLLRLYFPIKAADKITCISEFTKQEILKYVNAEIEVIHNPIDPTFSFVAKSFNSEKPRILHIGTGWNKNLKNTIEALKGVPCHLRIIGKLSDEIKTMLKALQIEYSNDFHLTDEQILNEYHQCDIVNFPSFYEGFGMPIIEGQATGRVVVSSEIEPLIEVSSGAVEYVNPNDVNSIRQAYLNIINDSQRRENLIAKGLENVKRFSVSHICGQYLQVYKDLLK